MEHHVVFQHQRHVCCAGQKIAPDGQMGMIAADFTWHHLSAHVAAEGRVVQHRGQAIPFGTPIYGREQRERQRHRGKLRLHPLAAGDRPGQVDDIAGKHRGGVGHRGVPSGAGSCRYRRPGAGPVVPRRFSNCALPCQVSRALPRNCRPAPFPFPAPRITLPP